MDSRFTFMQHDVMVPPVLRASSSEVCGDAGVRPQTESHRGNMDPAGPRSCHCEAKRAGETFFFDYHGERRVMITVARIFNTYGPRMVPGDGCVVSTFIVLALKSESGTVFGDGTQLRLA